MHHRSTGASSLRRNTRGGALKHIQPGAHSDESGFLNTFDSHRDLIYAAAARKYVRGSRGSYDLVAGDF
ncbi:DUF1488 domain-containing protein [Bradyrhizobium betae]|uniref:DUF1488 domain-containing protein n=1 Tax=Bradyrhizobium betae TaxID=244734 RepID=A0A5P6PH36_9BRAD|nr:DUF1488 domain-containing protein [Bradyrhizobium betae]